MVTKRFVNPQLPPAGMNENHYRHQTLGNMLKLLFELMQIHLHWFCHANTPWQAISKYKSCVTFFPKNSHVSFIEREASNGCLCLKKFPQTKKHKFIAGLFFVCQWHLYLLSVTSLFNIFIWRPINKKRRPRLGRNPSKFNLCVHKALHLSKWHFPISAFDSIDFFLPSSLRPLSMHGWNNKGSWVDFLFELSTLAYCAFWL